MAKVSEIDDVYRRVQEGDREAFASWMRLCETPLRRSLRPFAPYVDVESIVQEALLRMWTLGRAVPLVGENATLRYALRIARNLTVSEMRRLRTVRPADLERLERLAGATRDPDPPVDHWLRQAILRCIEKLPRRPREALNARLRGGPDRELAFSLGMELNTFFQNIVRARRLMAECLEGAGVNVEDHL